MAGIQGRIILHPLARWHVDVGEFSWLLSEHNRTVVGHSDCSPTGESVIFVKATYVEQISRFADEINGKYGPLIFKEIEVLDGRDYVDLSAYLSERVS